MQHDLCLVKMPGLPVRAAEVANSKSLHVGDKVYAVGFNGGRRLTYEEGEVSELYALDGGMVIRTTAAFSQGASGGGPHGQRVLSASWDSRNSLTVLAENESLDRRRWIKARISKL